MGAQQWRTAQESLLSLENNSVASVDSIFRYTILSLKDEEIIVLLCQH